MKWTDVTSEFIDVTHEKNTVDYVSVCDHPDRPEAAAAEQVMDSKFIYKAVMSAMYYYTLGLPLQEVFAGAIAGGVRLGWHVRDNMESTCGLEAMFSREEQEQIMNELKGDMYDGTA